MKIKTITFDYTGSMQTWIPPDGVYKIKIECFGAKGGGSMGSGYTYNYGGYGGYCCGEYTFQYNSQRKLYIYVGGAGIDGTFSDVPGGWNGGGIGTYDRRDDEAAGSGGGASDVRLVADSDGSWYDTSHKSWDTDKSLLSRIIVAGGGGGFSSSAAGVGGGLTGGMGGNNTSQPATQTSGYAFGKGQDAWSVVWDGGDGNIGQGGGGGGWYGGYTSPIYPNVSGCGGSSYYGNLANAKTIAGVNNGKGKVVISYEVGIFCLEYKGNYYIPIEKYFDLDSKSFIPLSKLDMYNSMVKGEMCQLNVLYNPFVIDGVKYYPYNIFDYTNSRICLIDIDKYSKVNISYTLSENALNKTNIKIKDKYTPLALNLLNPYLDITGINELGMTYSIKYDSKINIIDKKSNLIDIEILKDDFYLSFKFDNSCTLLSSITLYTKDKVNYQKIKDNNFNLISNYENTFMTFKQNYNKVLINKLTKQKFKYINDTLDTF